MKILRIVSSGYEQGGAENALVYSNEYLRSAGHEVITISSNSRSDLDHYSDYEFEEIPKKGMMKLLRMTFNFQSYRLAKKVAMDFQPDIVTLHTLTQPSASVLFALKNYRQVLCIHGPEGYTKALLPWVLGAYDYYDGTFDLRDLTLLGKAHYGYFKFVYGPIFMLGLKHVKHALSYSHYTQRIMLEEGIKSDYIPEGVQLFDYSPKQKMANVVGYAGRLEKHKGVDILIRAMPLVVKDVPEARLIIAGEGSYKTSLVKLVDQLG